MRLPFGQDARLARLLRRSRAGDREAFRALYRALHPRVEAFVARRLSLPADREDVVSRTFHRLLERLDLWDADRGGVLPFALAIARNAIIDLLRAQKPTVAVEDAELIEPARPDLALERRQRAEALYARLAELPAELREMFALRFGDGLSHREIAELLGLSEAAVKQRFSRALRELAAEVQAEASAEVPR